MKAIITITIALITFCSCKKEAIKYTTKQVSLENFSKLDISNNVEIQVAKAATYSILITGKITDVDDVITTVQNGELKIGYANTQQNRDRLLVKITMPFLLKFNFSANSNFSITGFDESQVVEGTISNNTNGTANIKATEFNLTIQNNAELMLSGSAEKIKCTVYGNSYLHTYNVLAKTVEAIANGNSQIKTYANQVINASSSGNSIIYFKGNPGNKFLAEQDNSRIIEQ